MSASDTGVTFAVISFSISAARSIPCALAASSISLAATRSSSAARRASNSACDSLAPPKLETGCSSALSSTSASVIAVPPTVATVSVGAGRFSCCAAVCEQAVNMAISAARVNCLMTSNYRSFAEPLRQIGDDVGHDRDRGGTPGHLDRVDLVDGVGRSVVDEEIFRAVDLERHPRDVRLLH